MLCSGSRPSSTKSRNQEQGGAEWQDHNGGEHESSDDVIEGLRAGMKPRVCRTDFTGTSSDCRCPASRQGAGGSIAKLEQERNCQPTRNDQRPDQLLRWTPS